MRAVIYARYSSDMQREESVEAQVRAAKEHIKKNNDTLVGLYIDRAYSARSDKRPDFQRMIEDSKYDIFDKIVIHKLDRFSRDRYDHVFYKRELRQNGVLLESVLEKLDGSPESIILESMLEGFSEYYSRNLSREVMKGKKETALECKHTGGIPPFGYDVGIDRKYVINENEAKAVRYIFESYLAGDGYESIFRWLRDNGIKGKRGGIIAKNSLHDILSNEKYTGVYIYNKAVSKDVYGKRNGHKDKPQSEIIRIDGGMPEIISKKTFERVKEEMTKNKTGKNRAKEPYLLSGLIFCANCGSSLVGCSRGNPRTPTEITRKYYECNTKKRKKTCNLKSVNRDEIEEAVILYLESIVNKDKIDEMSDWLMTNSKIYLKTSKTELSETRKELQLVSKNVEQLLDKILNGLDSEAARQRLSEAEAKKLQLEIKVADMEIKAQSTAPISKANIKKYLSQIHNIRKKTRKEQAQIIKQYIKRIEVFPESEDGEDRKFKITTNLDILLNWGEDRKGVIPSPPKKASPRIPRACFVNIFKLR